MRELFAIARKEWQAAFGTPLAWSLLAAYSFMSGLIFLGLLQSFLDAQAQVRELPGGWGQLPDDLLIFRSLTHGVFANLWAALLVVTLLLVPFLAMRSFAEERRRGTLHQLLANPLRPSTIVVGKFIGLGLVLLALLATSLIYVVLIRLFGGAETRLDLAPILLGWATTVLWGLTNLAIGIFLSALVRSSTAAAFLGVGVSFSWLVVKSLAPSGKGHALLEALSFEGLLTPLISGTLDPRPIAILLSIAASFLVFATFAVEGLAVVDRRFFGALGALLLLTAPVTAFLTDDVVILAAKLALGVLFIALWAFRGPRLTLSPRTRFRARAAGIGLLVVLAAVALNLFVGRIARPLDVTAERLRSLSATSISVIKALPSGVTLTTAAPLSAISTALIDRYRYAGARISLRNAPGEAVLSLDGTTRKTPIALPRLEANATAEQEFTRALKRLTAKSAVELLYLVGHGEPPLESLAAAPSLADEGFALRPYDLGRVEAVSPADAVVVLVAPRQPLPPREVAMLAAHLSAGGRLMYFTEPKDNAGIDALLEAYGIQLEDGTVNDTRFDKTRPTLILAPFIGKHPITEALEGARVRPIFLTTRALTLLRGPVRASPLVITAPDASVRSSDDAPQRQGQLVLAAASPPPEEGPRLVVFGDSDLLGEMFALNHDLVLNAFTWLAGRELLPTLRPKDPALSTLLMAGSTVQAIRFVVVDVIPIVFLAIGLYIGRRRTK